MPVPATWSASCLRSAVHETSKQSVVTLAALIRRQRADSVVVGGGQGNLHASWMRSQRARRVVQAFLDTIDTGPGQDGEEGTEHERDPVARGGHCHHLWTSSRPGPLSLIVNARNRSGGARRRPCLVENIGNVSGETAGGPVGSAFGRKSWTRSRGNAERAPPALGARRIGHRRFTVTFTYPVGYPFVLGSYPTIYVAPAGSGAPRCVTLRAIVGFGRGMVTTCTRKPPSRAVLLGLLTRAGVPESDAADAVAACAGDASLLLACAKVVAGRCPARRRVGSGQRVCRWAQRSI